MDLTGKGFDPTTKGRKSTDEPAVEESFLIKCGYESGRNHPRLVPTGP